MAAVLQLEPRFIESLPPVRRLRLVEPDRQPRPRSARRHQRAVYRRRRVLAALVGLGIVLAIARAGVMFGGSYIATPERLPHVHHVVVQSGDSLWSVAERLAPGRDVRPIVDAMEKSLGTSTLIAGEAIDVATY
jgi:hypothetical protein